MAHIIDARNGGGEIVLLGTSLSLPASSTSVSPVIGSVRYNPDNGLVEFYAPVNGGNPGWSSVASTTSVTANYLPLTGGSISGNVVVQGTLTCANIVGTTTAAFYAADLAERYAADAVYEPGTVLVIGGTAEVTISTMAADPKVAGIVSIRPALTMNSAAGPDSSHPFIALKGRVPCKVVGPVARGDRLTTSTTPGCAMAAPSGAAATAILGTALSSCSAPTGVIEVKV